MTEIRNGLHAKRTFKIQIAESEQETFNYLVEEANNNLSDLLSKEKHAKIKSEILGGIF